MTARRIGIAAAAVLVMIASASAQWLTYPTADIPRTADGKPNLSAPTPRTPDGKPQLAGLWRPSPGMVGDIARNLKPGEVPFQPWADATYKERRANNSKDDPTATCIVGGNAEGRRAAAVGDSVVAACAGGTALAAHATATPAKNLRRLTCGRGCFRAMAFLP